MTIEQVENNINKLVKKGISQESFIYDLLLAYGTPKATVTRLKKGNSNLSKIEKQLILKKKLLFQHITDEDLHVSITNLANDLKHGERFVIVTDYNYLLAIDTKTQDKLDIRIEDINRYFDFFLPLAGMEKQQYQNENPADVKAAVRMAQLYDEIRKDNPDDSPEFNHSLNIFFARLLFCFFAEDTNIFPDGIFTNSIGSHTQVDGSDLDSYLDKLFLTLDMPSHKRNDLPAYLNDFPYVNGGLFKEKIQFPKFTKHSRRVIIDAGELDWTSINPDIFGSMFQGVISEEKRGNLGMHYTSVPNIMKLIKPLFLDELYEELESANGNSKKLQQLLNRIRAIKIFDPACGSGNFLIIAYKELRRLEMDILEELSKSQMMLFSTGIKLSNFYGIEIDDFASEIAKLALWLAEHQMHIESFNKFGQIQATLPLKEAGNIVCGNATRLDWEEVCPKKQDGEIYILGNPPYLGARLQNKFQKDDMKAVFSKIKQKYNNLDYISCWFYKGANYIRNSNVKLAFVSTNSICQGEQVGILWENILDDFIEIYFAYKSFKWNNNAKSKANVIVVIIGLRNISNSAKYLYQVDVKQEVKYINAYLVNGSKIVVNRRSNPISNLPKMSFGNMPNDGGGLILSTDEKNKLITEFPNSIKFIRKFVGSSEFIRGNERFCLWIDDTLLSEANSIPFIKNRIELTRQHRLNSKDKGAQKLSNRPHQFRDLNVYNRLALIIPANTSERRDYIPIGFLSDKEVISNSAQAIYDPEYWLMGVVSSNIHMVWMRAVGGRLKTDYRYSKDIVYNAFPFPELNKQHKSEITETTLKILEVRENYPEKTMAQLYDPDKMPDDLREAHRLNDLAVERCYRSKPFESDEERLEYLFKLYEKMIEEEKK